jgi:prepilin-type N-terminal cleavage/methylation domain-containing protein
MRRGIRGRQRGVTLPEVVTATVVLSIVVGSVCAIYSSAMQSWYRGAAENYAEQKASLAVERMVPDLQQGMAVTAATSPYESVCIAVQLPARAWSSSQGAYLNQLSVGVDGRLHLVQGDFAVYYRGDADGNIAVDGDRVWRRVVRASDGAALKEQVIADHVVDNPPDGTGSPKPMFIYWPDIYRLRSVEVTLTVKETYGHRSATKTMSGELALRNN